jgi:hypothetical protein
LLAPHQLPIVREVRYPPFSVRIAKESEVQFTEAYPRLVWASFGSWLRIVRPGIPPSEFVTATARSHSLPEFLTERHKGQEFKEFLRENIDVTSYEALRLAG